MSIFNFSKKERYAVFDTISIDNVYSISLPKELIYYSSDRFRARTKDKKVDLSITNYGKKITKDHSFGIEDLKNQFLPLFDKFINEGGYLSNKDLEIGDNYIYQSFNVEKETQYYYYTSISVGNNMRVIIAIIIRQKGKLDAEHAQLIKKIGKSIIL